MKYKSDNPSGDRLARFLELHTDALRRNGSIVQKWRTRDGRRFGPYLLLTCRDAEGTQRAVYLRTKGLQARARAALAALRAPRQQARQLARARQALKRGQRAAQGDLRRQLGAVGLVLKGTEIRGWSHVAHLSRRDPLSIHPDGVATKQFLEKRVFVDQQKDV
jgi:hypothetical protein